jgi:hypothetical protein
MKRLLILMNVVSLCFISCAKRIEICGGVGVLVPNDFHLNSVKRLDSIELPHTTIKSTLVDTIPIRKLPKKIIIYIGPKTYIIAPNKY